LCSSRITTPTLTLEDTSMQAISFDYRVPRRAEEGDGRRPDIQSIISDLSSWTQTQAVFLTKTSRGRIGTPPAYRLNAPTSRCFCFIGQSMDIVGRARRRNWSARDRAARVSFFQQLAIFHWKIVISGAHTTVSWLSGTFAWKRQRHRVSQQPVSRSHQPEFKAFPQSKPMQYQDSRIIR
jgi:hypothetical protein